MSYEILIQPAAQRQLKKLPLAVQKDLVVLLERLAQEPRPLGCKKLKGRQNQYRVRLGDYRIIYSIEEMALVIRVIKVGHRRDIYEEP
ncbi:type II toxin-antitoxin system RelE/ParE family toxin [Nodosilinea sp. FACHB-131]|uniref:type II toxin-antitoxin system RelE family toxin n=1 Tax=Cyanophyceae TaxID=3028117 RepID=UPI00168699E1|nr:type II toxin-antitoxin system RelE/ParE family toxin [Nodosilinea sp. FACHB-131]MBD1876845.1 type II toxin-antitoxin system RelE/ParE family toxin [Nodosilinea sp. FACHB-131]